ncbi:class I adenylate-forming enzyme family protein [Pendulispora albinea]|uniref:AMP-binding protein n=1 Tax=Pendulispora albinea TaxID=2741071 RepID=A0ABZ2LPB2_9BACT
MPDELSVWAAAREVPQRTALVADGAAVSYVELAHRVQAAAAWLARQGIAAGHPGRVALVAAHDEPTLLVLLALIDLGVTVVLIHPRLTPRERALLIADTTPSLVVEAPGPLSPLEAAPATPGPTTNVPVDGAHAMCILFTSGTTGRAKGVLLSRNAFRAAARASEANLGWREDDRWLLGTSLAHVAGLSVVMRCLIARRTFVLPALHRFDPYAIEAVLHRDRVTLLSWVSPMLAQYLDAERTMPRTVRAILLGGGPASPRLLQRAKERGLPIVTTYGLTESCAQVTTQILGTPPGPEQGAGPPLPGNEVRIVDGEVHVRGPSRMSGYFPPGAHPDAVDPEGWLHTGDHGHLDEAGRLHVSARRADRIVTGGENVSPVEVEHALEQLEAVRAVCVFGVADETWGAVVAAAIVWNDPARGCSDPDLARALAAMLAPSKRPRLLAVLDDLAWNAGGKLDRAETAKRAIPHLRSLPGAPNGSTSSTEHAPSG